jgi:hypothetical protein
VGADDLHQESGPVLDGDIPQAFFEAVLIHADTADLLSDDHFTVGGTLLEAWASHKSVRARDEDPPSQGGGTPPSTLMGSVAPTPPISRPPIPTRVSTTRPAAAKRVWGIWATS